MIEERPKYLPLTNDLVFRRYFTTNKHLLLLLINSFLPFSKHVSDAAVLNLDRVDMPDDLAEVAKQQQQSGSKLILTDTSIPPDKPHGRSVVLDLSVKQEGRVQGMQEKQRGIALSMLQEGLEVSLISKVTGLSVAEIGQLNQRTAD